MDFSFKSIILFLVVIFPGIIFRRFFFQGEFTKQFNSKPWLQSALYSLIPGLLIHTFLLYFIDLGYGLKNVNLSPLEKFYENLKTQNLEINLIDFNFIGLTLVYYLIILFLSWLFAIISWSIVRELRLDSKYKVFRFANYWNYYFKGEIKYFKEFQGVIEGKVLYVKADVLMSSEEEKPRLYNGELRQYTINKDNTLENIYLTNVKSYTGKRNENGKAETKSIPGDCLIVPGKNITNINLNYFADNKKKKVNYDSIIVFLWFIFIVYLVISNLSIFTSDTIFKTVLVKIYYIFYSFLIIGLISIIIKPKIRYDESVINNFDNSSSETTPMERVKYRLEVAKKNKKKSNKNALIGLIIIITIMLIISILFL